MHNVKSARLPILLAAVFAATGQAHAVSITITGGNLKSETDGGIDQANPAWALTNYNSTVTSGDEFATSIYTFSNAAFNVGITGSQDGSAVGNFAQTNGGIAFTVATPTTYTASGFYNATGTSYVILDGLLQDQTTNTIIFESTQVSESTPNASFVLGGSLGDYSNVNSGSLTGILIPGQEYGWGYDAYIDAYPNTDAGSTSIGNITFAFADATPLPSAVWSGLSVLALVGCLSIRRRRQALA